MNASVGRYMDSITLASAMLADDFSRECLGDIPRRYRSTLKECFIAGFHRGILWQNQEGEKIIQELRAKAKENTSETQ